MQSIFNNYFQNISDPRPIRNQRHPQGDLMKKNIKLHFTRKCSIIVNYWHC